ncbi:hypothetical protein NE619_17850 [Anaerovorax odorimutans]|uniref:Uncharacterized protein n=1 Tax=Anaerovorax odorimutans TaxID=109327 RepID=A0ABT1RTX0_9FIRM|nr:zinc ribbon domain-containing protein [Anaerovorax odorimutans]MCQ4638596.1 hypothetical protein [Anaerovorax odorimutans]
MKDYFLPQKLGGQTASLISNQDSLATVYIVEQLNNADIFDFGINITDFSMQCETDNDLCIVNTEYKIFIQLKSAKIVDSQFRKILDNFMENFQNEPRKSFFVVVTFESFTIKDKKIIDRFDNYRNILRDPNETKEKKERVKEELIEDFELSKYADIIDRIKIVNRPLFRDDKDVPAIFSRYLRLAYGLKDQREYLIDNIYNELIAQIEKTRRTRGFISKEKIETIIGKNLVKDTIFDKFDLLIGYEKVENGYKKKIYDNEELVDLEKGSRKAVKKIFKSWRKAYKKEFFVSMLCGNKRCPECGHPMIANIKGLFGIACPNCGYSPYVTMFATCNCGNYEVIKTQPELSDSKVFTYMNEFYYNDRRCSKCNRLLSDKYFELRVVMLPVPYPFYNYKNIDEIYENSKY